jgi:hypothetical protein
MIIIISVQISLGTAVATIDCHVLVSVIGGSTVVQMPGKATEVYTREWHTPDYEARTRFIVRVLRC